MVDLHHYIIQLLLHKIWNNKVTSWDLISLLQLLTCTLKITHYTTVQSLILLYLLGKRPTIGQLLSLSGRGGKKLQIIREVTPHWRYLAQQFGFDDLLNVETLYPRAPEELCCEMFVRWLDEDNDSSKITWETLIQCLIEAGLMQVADDLKECVH